MPSSESEQKWGFSVKDYVRRLKSLRQKLGIYRLGAGKEGVFFFFAFLYIGNFDTPFFNLSLLRGFFILFPFRRWQVANFSPPKSRRLKKISEHWHRPGKRFCFVWGCLWHTSIFTPRSIFLPYYIRPMANSLSSSCRREMSRSSRRWKKKFSFWYWASVMHYTLCPQFVFLLLSLVANPLAALSHRRNIRRTSWWLENISFCVWASLARRYPPSLLSSYFLFVPGNLRLYAVIVKRVKISVAEEDDFLFMLDFTDAPLDALAVLFLLSFTVSKYEW